MKYEQSWINHKSQAFCFGLKQRVLSTHTRVVSNRIHINHFPHARLLTHISGASTFNLYSMYSLSTHWYTVQVCVKTATSQQEASKTCQDCFTLGKSEAILLPKLYRYFNASQDCGAGRWRVRSWQWQPTASIECFCRFAQCAMIDCK